MKEKYVKIEYRQNDGSYRGDYLYKDETEEGLKIGDFAQVSTWLDPKAIARVTAVNIPLEEVSNVKKNLYPGDIIKSIFRKIDFVE